MGKILTFIFLIIVLIVGALIYIIESAEPNPVTEVVLDSEPKLISRFTYMCKDDKSIDASFYEGVASTSLSGQVVPSGIAKVVLSDGRNYELPQTISASGVRYATPNEDFVFWTKGNGALVLEDNAEKNYLNCVLVQPAMVGVNLPESYASDEGTFSLRLPSLLSPTSDGYTIDEDFKNQITPEQVIDGVKFTIPATLATGTNLSKDTYLSVESIPNTSICSADLFFDNSLEVATSTLEDRGVVYSVATSSEAAAGNRYQEKVFAIPGTNPCIAVRYMVHYGVIENYDPSVVKEFDAVGLVNQFDQIRHTLVVNQ